MSRLPPMHPGEILREEFLLPNGLSAGAVAQAIGVPRTRIERLAAEQVDLTPDTALRLARYFGTSAAFWINIQGRFAIERTMDELGSSLDDIVAFVRRGGRAKREASPDSSKRRTVRA